MAWTPPRLAEAARRWRPVARQGLIRSLALLGLLAGMTGCTAPTVIRFNDREIEYERLDSASFDGNEITHMDKTTIVVKGSDSIRINGTDVWAEDNEVQIGGREFTVAEKDRVIVDRLGGVHVVAQTRPPVWTRGGPRSTSNPEDEGDPEQGEKREVKTLPAAAPAGSQKDESFWSFLR